MQATLFDAPTSSTTPLSELVDWEAASAWAFLYTGTAAGTNSGIRFMMCVEEAQAWCSAPESKGVLHGTHWAYFWTSVANFLRRDSTYAEIRDPVIDLRKIVDNGSWDERVAKYGKKINTPEIPRILNPLGIKTLI